MTVDSSWCRVATLLLVAIVGLPDAAFSQEDKLDCTFDECDHSDPEVRDAILWIAQGYMQRRKPELADKIWIAVIRRWQDPDQVRDLRTACLGLFLNLAGRDQQDSHGHLLEGCPAEQMDILYGRVDHGPIPLVKVSPRLSASRAPKSPEVEFLVEFVVGENGRVRDVEVISSEFPKFDKAIKRAAKMATFIPASMSGEWVAWPNYRTRFVVHTSPKREYFVEIEDIEPNPLSEDSQDKEASQTRAGDAD